MPRIEPGHQERLRLQRWEDEEKSLDLEERREAGRATRTLQAKRLHLEEKRLAVPVPAVHSAGDGGTADRQYRTTAHRHNGVTATNGHPAPLMMDDGGDRPPPRPVPGGVRGWLHRLLRR